MRMLRSIGIALLLVGFLFKVMHWPGASLALVLGCAVLAVRVAVVLSKGRLLSAGEMIRPIAGVLLLITALMHALQWPGGTLALYSMVVLVAVTLLSDRTRVDLPRLTDLHAPGLLAVGLVLVCTGFIFHLMHWPTAGIQLSLGLLCGVVWTLLPKRLAQRES
ncbi:MAG TPA: hypothetical protein VGE21_07595 [Flavobacteriales bacterium]